MNPKPQFSLFKNLQDKNPTTINLNQFAEMIADGEWQEPVSKVRAITDEVAQKKAKEKLPIVTVSGVFSKGHKASDLKQHSGLICMDFDLQDNPQLQGCTDSMREQLAEDEYGMFVFISARGKGLAVICQIDPSCHKESFEWLSGYYLDQYGLTADESCKDVCRPRFVSWDTDAALTEAKQSCCVEVCSKTLHTLHNAEVLILHHAREYLVWFEGQQYYRLYTLLMRKFTAKRGQRNHILTKKLVPFLYGAVAERIAMEWAEAFYWYNAGIFKDPIEQHMREAQTAWDNCESNYRDYLTLREQEYFDYIAGVGTSEQLTLFRICRSLSVVDDPDLQIGIFALSAEQCRFRLGLKYDMQGQRLLSDKLYKQYGVLELISSGKKRTKGSKGVSNIWFWTIGASEEEVA